MKAIILAIPIFFILIGVELLVGKLKKTELYRFNDAVTNISCGLISQVTGVLIKTFTLVLYIFLHENFRLFDIQDTWWSWLLLFIGVDFFYYWFHRYAHEISAFWGTHIVHHQSEEYNLSVALRQSALQPIISSFFYLPLVLIGFNPVSFLLINALQTLYQFWIHTKTIGKLHPSIEFLFNTPSHHRVHHGVNPKYIDRNHGGTFIIFDRMFGTFQEEEEVVVYGTVTPFASWNPIWANVNYYSGLWKEMALTKSWLDKVKMLVKRPGWRPAYLGGAYTAPPVEPEQVTKYDTTISPRLNQYILIQFIVILVAATFFLLEAEGMGWLELILGNFLVLWSLLSLGGLLELKTWAFRIEQFRLVLLTPLAFILGDLQGYGMETCLFFAFVCLPSFLLFFKLKRTKY